MKITLKAALAATAAVAALAVPMAASAHRPWFVPSATNFSGNDPWVTVDAAISNDLFYADHFPMQLGNVKAIGPQGEDLKLENSVVGRYRSTFDVHLTQPGTSRVLTVSNGVQGTYVNDGKTYRLGGGRGGPPPAPGAQGPGGPGAGPQGPGPQAAGGPPAGGPGGRPQTLQGVAEPSQIPAGSTEIKLVQTSARNETFITRGAPTPIKLSNQGLELTDGGTAPTDLVADEPASLKLLMDGKPAADVEVTVVPADQRFQSELPEQKIKTGADGVFKVTWPRAGYYWINATANAAGTIPNATRRASYTATLEVQKP